MVYGRYDLILPEHEQIYAFTRTLEDERLLVLLNFSAGALDSSCRARSGMSAPSCCWRIIPVDPGQDIRQFGLRPYEARVYRLRK